MNVAPPPVQSAKYRLDWDETRGAVLFEKTGEWTREDSVACMAHFLPLVERSRERNGHALLLIDATGTTGQSTDYMNSAKSISGKVMREGDRVAIVVSSSVIKTQLNRIGSNLLTFGFFLSRSAAETWLYAHQI